MSSESTRITLIKCMKKLMRKTSFFKLSVEEICQTAHVSRRTFYRHFPDKYSLLQATYIEGFHAKLDISEEDTFWDIFEKICHQVNSDKFFFKHALEVEGQNGFREELIRLWVPLFKKDLPLNEVTDRESTYYTKMNVSMILHFIEEWLSLRPDQSPEQFARYVRSSFAVYGKWTYELAVNKPRSQFSSDYVTDIHREIHSS